MESFVPCATGQVRTDEKEWHQPLGTAELETVGEEASALIWQQQVLFEIQGQGVYHWNIIDRKAGHAKT